MVEKILQKAKKENAEIEFYSCKNKLVKAVNINGKNSTYLDMYFSDCEDSDIHDFSFFSVDKYNKKIAAFTGYTSEVPVVVVVLK